MVRLTAGALVCAMLLGSSAARSETPPWPAFAIDTRVRVEIGGSRIGQVVSVEGNLFTTQVLLFREGGGGGTMKLPGVSTPGDVIVRRLVRTDDVLWDWYQQILAGNLQRKDVAIVYLGPGGQPAVRFDLARCFPSAYALHAGNNLLTVASVEAVTLSCEGATRTVF